MVCGLAQLARASELVGATYIVDGPALTCRRDDDLLPSSPSSPTSSSFGASEHDRTALYDRLERVAGSCGDGPRCESVCRR